jgi:RsiW-degrading membrane proteinase PrsW (M82 family)
MFIILLAFIGIVIWLTWFLLSRDRGAKEPVGALWAAGAFGVLAIAIAMFLNSWLPIDRAIAVRDLDALFMSFLAVGIIEETAKFLPLALFIFKKQYFNEHTDGIIYFALAGLAFGLIENVVYTVNHGNGTGLTRIVMVPFFHAATTGIVGYYLSKAKLDNKSWATALPALGALAVIHGVYNFGLTSGIGIFILLSAVLTLLLSVGLFLFYMRANELDKAQGLSTVGINNFCRACGTPNLNHTLFCESCGKQT